MLPVAANEPIRTPPFVRWTLVHGCQIRECDGYADPDRTERLLRGARCYSDAVREGRIRNGIVLQQHTSPESAFGFDVATVLNPLGGVELLQELCSGCPANALGRKEPTALAGCFGFIVPPVEEILPTHARWLELWINERPSPEELVTQRELLSKIPESQTVVGLADYLSAIAAALEHRLALVVRAYPGGRCEGRRWYVEAHCDRCKAGWPEQRRQQCWVCGQVGGRQPELRRMRMGTRPYRRLSEFLSADQIAELF